MVQKSSQFYVYGPKSLVPNLPKRMTICTICPSTASLESMVFGICHKCCKTILKFASFCFFALEFALCSNLDPRILNLGESWMKHFLHVHLQPKRAPPDTWCSAPRSRVPKVKQKPFRFQPSSRPCEWWQYGQMLTGQSVTTRASCVFLVLYSSLICHVWKCHIFWEELVEFLLMPLPFFFFTSGSVEKETAFTTHKWCDANWD